MKTGIEKINRFFSREDFIWFDRKEVRAAEALTPEEKKYIKSWTLAPLGFGYIIYLAMRVLPDILTVYIVTYLYFEIDEKIISRFVTPESVSLPLYIGYWAITLAFMAASLYSFYFTFRHGRRLSWNRGHYVARSWLKWEKENFTSVQNLKESENRFMNYSVFPTLALIAVVLVLFLLSL